MDALRERLMAARGQWRQRSPRERRLLALGAVVVGGALVWTVLLAPALRTLGQAPARIADLQRTLDRVSLQSQQLAELRRQPAAAAAPADWRAQVADWMRQHQQLDAVVAMPGGLQLVLHRLPASQLLELAGRARQDWGAEISAAALQLDAQALLSGTVDLAARAGGAP